MKKNVVMTVLAVVAFAFTTGFGGFDLGKTIGKGSDCTKGSKKERKKCMEKMALTTAATALASMAIDFSRKTVEPANKVDADYIKSHGSLPAQPTINGYQYNLRPTKAAKRGGFIEVVSDIVVVSGKSKKKVSVKERLVIYDPKDNKKVVRDSKLKDANDPRSKETGRLQTTYRLTIPKGAPQGQYPIATHLYFDNKLVKSNAGRLQIVQVENSNQVVAQLIWD